MTLPHRRLGRTGLEVSAMGLGAAHGVPLAAAALQFPLTHPTVTAVIPGATRAGMLTENAASLSFGIPDLLWQELIAEGFIDAQAPVPACGWQNEDGTSSRYDAR
jgi:aryl-alcohol dehydrogenase-like predicted oxidoreductase